MTLMKGAVQRTGAGLSSFDPLLEYWARLTGLERRGGSSPDAKRRHGVDSGGAAGGNIAGGQRHEKEQQRDAGERGGICSADVKKQALHYARQRERRADSGGYASGRQSEALSHDQPEDVSWLGAQRPPDA